MPNTLATMVTMTTYGTWLRGDRRGWVSDAETLPPEPLLEDADRRRLKHEPFLFDASQLLDVGQMIGDSLIERKDATILALTVGTWHCHYIVGATQHSVADIVKCTKEAVRYGLRAGRPIWTADYDKRFCFDTDSILARVRYVERHNEREGWPAPPWQFITDVNEYLERIHT